MRTGLRLRSATLSLNGSRGFSLIEVVIAIAITAMIGTLIASSFYTGFRARDTVVAEADKYRMLRVAMNRMVREIGSAYVSDRYDLRRYRDQNDRPTNFIGEEDKITFSSMAHERLYTDAKESDQMTVEYSVKQSPDREAKGRKDLMRRENPIVQDKMDRGGNEESLYEGIKRIEFEYWDADKKEWDDEWDTRRPERKANLPSRVKITLTAVDENNKETLYTTQARIMLNTEIPRTP
jgi:general secretion pathway protein J